MAGQLGPGSEYGFVFVAMFPPEPLPSLSPRHCPPPVSPNPYRRGRSWRTIDIRIIFPRSASRNRRIAEVRRTASCPFRKRALSPTGRQHVCENLFYRVGTWSHVPSFRTHSRTGTRRRRNKPHVDTWWLGGVDYTCECVYETATPSHAARFVSAGVEKMKSLGGSEALAQK